MFQILPNWTLKAQTSTVRWWTQKPTGNYLVPPTLQWHPHSSMALFGWSMGIVRCVGICLNLLGYMYIHWKLNVDRMCSELCIDVVNSLKSVFVNDVIAALPSRHFYLICCSASLNLCANFATGIFFFSRLCTLFLNAHLSVLCWERGEPKPDCNGQLS